MGDLCDHATDGWGVFTLDDLVETGKAEALDDELVLDRGADLGTEVLQLDFGGCVLGCHWTRAPLNLLSEELQLFDCLAAQGGDFGLVSKLDESVERGLDDIVRVRGAEALSKHVLHAGGGHNGAHRLAGDDASPFGGGLQHDLTGAVVAEDLVRDRALGEVDLVQVLLGGLDPLADGLWDFLRLAGTVADYAFTGITDDDECGEGHVLAALDDLGDAVDRNDLVLEVEAVRIDFFLHCYNVLSSFLATDEGAFGNLRNRDPLRGQRRLGP